MSEILPRPIEPQDIRVGDRICVAWSDFGMDRTSALTVAEVDLESMLVKATAAGGWVTLAPAGGATVTLLDRPEPEPERPAARPVGSHWRDPVSNVEYVVTDHLRQGSPLYVPYLNAAAATAVARGWSDRDAEIIARLVPVPPAFDPAVLWPPAKLNDDWCAVADKNSGYGCSRPAGHDGWVHAAYEAHSDRQELGSLLAVWGDPR